MLRSLDDEVAVDPREIDDAWAREIERRVDEIRSGRVRVVPEDVFLGKLRAKAERRRRSAR